MVIYARDVDDNQVKGFLVDTKTEGYSATKIENKISLRTVQNADITLDNVVVPEFFKLANANSFRDTNKVLKVTRLAVAWQAVGQQLAAFDVARRYAVERSQFGRPIASFQLVQHQLVQILGNAVSSMGMMVRLSQLEDAGPGEGRAVRPGQGVHHRADARKRGPGPEHPRRQRDRDGLRDGQGLLRTPKPSTPTRARTRSTPSSPAGRSRAFPRSSRPRPGRAVSDGRARQRPPRPVCVRIASAALSWCRIQGREQDGRPKVHHERQRIDVFFAAADAPVEAGRRRAAVAGLHLPQDIALRHGGPVCRCCATGSKLLRSPLPWSIVMTGPVDHDTDKAHRSGRRRGERGAVVGCLQVDTAVTAEPRLGRGIEGAQDRRPGVSGQLQADAGTGPTPTSGPARTSGPAPAVGSGPGTEAVAAGDSARSSAARQVGIFMVTA